MNRIVCHIGLKAFFSIAVVCLIGLCTKFVCSVRQADLLAALAVYQRR